MHDLIAELQGYRNELANVPSGTDRADQIRQQITGVQTAIKDKAKQLEDQAANQEATGQDVPAAEARVEARRYRTALGEDADETGAEPQQDDGETGGGPEQDGAEKRAAAKGGRRPRGSAGKRDADPAKAPEQT